MFAGVTCIRSGSQMSTFKIIICNKEDLRRLLLVLISADATEAINGPKSKAIIVTAIIIATVFTFPSLS